jgi:hypothetical protein
MEGPLYDIHLYCIKELVADFFFHGNRDLE